MTRDLSAIYDAAFFESYNEEQEADIRAAADVIVDVLRPTSVLDVGCGPGMMVQRFYERKVAAYGIDGSACAIKKARPETRPFLAVVSATDPPIWTLRDDVVVCTEVAEHIPESYSDRLVYMLTENAHCYIVFTAAPPGQGGHDHINEQPMSYWVDKFAARGFDVDEAMTAAIRAGWEPLKRCWYYAANVRVFKRRA